MALMSAPRVCSPRWVVLCGLLVGALACTSETEPPPTTDAAANTPTEVVSALLTAVDQGRFEDTARYTDNTQAALFALAEGATVSEVASAVEAEAGPVAANFWSGFAQSLGEGFGPGEVTVGDAEETTAGSSRFALVPVTPSDGTQRVFVLRRDNGWRVDLFASFAPIVAESLVPAVEGVLGSANADASAVLSGLAGSADSLRVAVSDRDLPADTQQTVLALLERVTRADS